MYCKHCGKQIADNAVICVHCGVATRNMVAYQQNNFPVPPNITIVNTNTNANSGYNYTQALIYDYRSRWAAFFLCLFLGWAGVHRFYMRKAGTGVLWLFTGGLFGIGWFIDTIVLLFDGYSDGNGHPLV